MTTGMVTLSGHDVHRLLLQFRQEIEENQGGQWTHGADWDDSFERIADALDERNAGLGRKPDQRLRCNHKSPVYKWPERYAGRWINIQTRTSRAAPNFMHLSGGYGALCGFGFAPADIVRRPARDYGKCPVCVREIRVRGNVTVLD